MKKFYAFAAAALLATAANAQTLYFCGAGEGLGWDPENPLQVDAVDGKITLEVADLTQFKMSETPGDWDTFNASAWGCDYGDEPGVTVALELGWGANIATPWKGDWKIEVAADYSTVTLTTNTPKPAETLPELYFRGDMNGWGAPEEWKFEALSSTVFKFVCPDGIQVLPGESFKIADADWNKYNFGFGSDLEPLLLECSTQIFGGSNPANMTVEEPFTGVAWLGLNIEIDGEEQVQLFLSNDKDAEPEWLAESAVSTIEVANEAPVYFNLQGVRVANPVKGIYVKVVNGKASKTLVK